VTAVAVENARKALDDAKKCLEVEKKRGGKKTRGTFWWMDREIEEAEKYLPQSKQRKKKKTTQT